MEPLRIGTRGSKLARRQVDLVVEALRAARPDTGVEIVTVQTEGDRRLDLSLDAAGGQGVFVKDIEQRLLREEIDMAVHSLKDMPSEAPDGLVIGAVLPRADARDVLVARDGHDLAALPAGARIGSDSSRRSAQILAMRPDVTMAGIRGNVDTRLRKVDEGEYDAVALAAAGLTRLGLFDRATEVFDVERVIPAPGQGAIAVQCRAGDSETLALLSLIDDAATRAATEAERSFLRVLGAGCRLPVGAFATVEDGRLSLRAFIADDRGRIHRGEASGETRSATAIGKGLAWRLKQEAGV